MLESIRHGDILELRLARPPVNALDPALLTALWQAIEVAPSQGARALVISGSERAFSAGLDVPVLLSLGRAELKQAWQSFFEVCAALARSPLLSAAAITGHSPAGGAVIALFCDYRIMTRGDFRIGLNETQVGLAVPECIQYALKRVVGIRHAERLLLSGAMLEAAQAHSIGLVDELADPAEVVPQALAWLENHLQLPQQALAQTRAIARADLVAAVADPTRLDLLQFIDDWYREETQSVLHAVVKRLKEKA